ncbi:MAG: DUF2845 domain-containing protein [Pseudomonadaceae bacterium]|jgi:hypothetical protein|nr:DUF2845 domain-containing protein [Pseudomonadaceae bacterium]
MKRPLYLLALLLPLLSLPAHAGFRCGQKLVNEGDRITEVLRKCGQPASRDLLGYTDTINGNLGLQIEEWSYGPNNGMYYYLTFEGGRLRTIETKRGQ